MYPHLHRRQRRQEEERQAPKHLGLSRRGVHRQLPLALPRVKRRSKKPNFNQDVTESDGQKIWLSTATHVLALCVKMCRRCFTLERMSYAFGGRRRRRRLWTRSVATSRRKRMSPKEAACHLLRTFPTHRWGLPSRNARTMPSPRPWSSLATPQRPTVDVRWKPLRLLLPSPTEQRRNLPSPLTMLPSGMGYSRGLD